MRSVRCVVGRDFSLLNYKLPDEEFLWGCNYQFPMKRKFCCCFFSLCAVPYESKLRRFLWMKQQRCLDKRYWSLNKQRQGDNLWRFMNENLLRVSMGLERVAGRRAGILDHKNNLFLIKRNFFCYCSSCFVFLELHERLFPGKNPLFYEFYCLLGSGEFFFL